MRPGRKYFNWEDRSGGTKEGSGKSRIKDRGENVSLRRRRDISERNRQSMRTERTPRQKF